jgi:UDPglucose 6-dehydrogenase
MNEIFELTQTQGLDFDDIVRMAASQDRIGHTHNSVPGPDGRKGFGGTCFPKDMAALIQWSHDQGVSMDTLKAAHFNNFDRRDDLDIENHVPHMNVG